MVVEFAFGPEGKGLPHSHPHVQSTYVASGRFAFTVAGETREIGPGDSLVVPRARCIPATPSSRAC